MAAEKHHPADAGRSPEVVTTLTYFLASNVSNTAFIRIGQATVASA